MGAPVSGRDGEINRDFDVVIPDGATADEEMRLIEQATNREIEKLLYALGL